jgi:hypothetical protein
VEHIRSLSDLAQSYSLVREMSVVPVAPHDIIPLAITTAARFSRSASPSSPWRAGAAPGDGDQATMFVPPSTYTVPPVMRRAKGLAR